MKNSDFFKGIRDSAPIMAGYFSVSFTFGIMAASFGISPLTAGIISLTNLTSAGQFAGISLIYEGTTLMEIFLTQLIINLRYALMSLTLTQNLDKSVDTKRRMGMSYFVTDEIFAMAATSKVPVTFSYLTGLGVGSLLAWTLGTVAGGVTNNLLPVSVQSALGVALYGMFIAIVMPNIRAQKPVAIVCLITVVLSLLMAYVPGLRSVSTGFSIIICTVVASLVGAVFFPEAGE